MKKTGGALLIAAACGVFCALCFDVSWLAPFLWIALAPLFYLLLQNREQKKRAAGIAAVFCAALFLYYYAAFFSLDISHLAGQDAGAWLAAGWLAASLLHGGILLSALLLGTLLPCPRFWRAPLLAVCWAGAEWLFGFSALGLPCVRIGLTQIGFLPAVQSAQLGGVILIGALIVLVNVLLAQGALAKKEGPLVSARYLCAAALLFAANFTFGMAVLHAPAAQPDTSVAVIQYNVQLSQGEGEGRFEKALAMAGEAAAARPDLVMLPEDSVNGAFAEDQALQQACAEVTRQTGGDLFLGVYGIQGYVFRNAVYMVGPDGSVPDGYTKQRLVPFVENGYEKPFDWEISQNRGVFETEHGTVGALICFESLFSDVAADTVRQGAQLLGVFTNDSWFRSPVALERHMGQSAMRAVETGRYVVQAGNTGVSAVVTPRGEVTARLEANTEGILYGQVAFQSGSVPYLVLSDWWIVILAGISAVVMLLMRRKKN